MSAPTRKVSLIVSEQAENPERKSFDDSLNKIPPSISPDKRGSVPLFGSLIYYRSQSLDPNILSKPNTDDDANEMQLRDSTNINRRSFSYSHPENDQLENISNQLKEFRLSSGDHHHNHNITNLEAQDPINLDNETSDSEMSIYEPTTPTHSISKNKHKGVIEDPFNVIDAKVESQRRQSFHWFDDTLEKNKCRNKSRNGSRNESRNRSRNGSKNKNKNKIPNLDSDIVKNKNQNNKTDSSGILCDKSNDLNNSPNPKGEGFDNLDTPLKTQSCPRQGRHRRRLTCAMIFTKPKFVDI